MSLTPWQALRDPHLGFNLTVMRAADKARITALNIEIGRAGKSVEVAMAILLAALFEDQ